MVRRGGGACEDENEGLRIVSPPLCARLAGLGHKPLPFREKVRSRITPEGLAGADAKADAQCADLRRDVADPDQLAARRFSVGNHKATEADGKRINTLLRNTYCG